MGQMLVVRAANDTEVQVYRSNNGDLVAFGSAFTPAAMLDDATTINKSNLAVQFQGDFYVIVGSEVRKYNSGTQAWDTVVLPAFTLADKHQHTGFYVTPGPAGLLSLVVLLVVDSSGEKYRALRFNGTAWSLGAVGPAANIGASGFLGKGTIWRGQIAEANATDMVVYDPIQDSWDVQVIGSPGSYVHIDTAFALVKGTRLFAARMTSGAADQYLDVYEYTASTWTRVIDGSASTPVLARGAASTGAPGTTSGWCLLHYHDGDQRLVLHSYQDRGAASRGWAVVEINPDTMALTDRTSLVPVALRFPNGADSSGDVHFQVQVENEDSPTSPTTTIWLALAAGAWTSWRWPGGAGAIQDWGGSQGDRGLAIPHFTQGGGAYTYPGSSTASPGYHVQEVGTRTPISGGTRIYFTGWTIDESGGGPSSLVLDVELRYSLTHNGPRLVGTLDAVGKQSGAGATPTLVSNQAQGCTFDGSTVYYVDWLAISDDGVADQQLHQAMFRVVG